MPEKRFEIKEYEGLVLVARKGTPMPEEAWVDGEMYDEYNGSEELHVSEECNPNDYAWAYGRNARDEAISDAICYWG